MRELYHYGVHVRLSQEGGDVRATGTAGEYCFGNQTEEVIAAHLQTSSDALFATFCDHAARKQCRPANALLRELSTHVACRFIHLFNEWNNRPHKVAHPYPLDITWPVLERWSGKEEIVRFARTHAGPDWQAFAQCVALLSPEEFAHLIQRMQEYENGW